MNRHGQLVRTQIPLWAVSADGRPYRELRSKDLIYIALCAFPNSYSARAARDELDRRAPRTASLWYGPENGWDPIIELDESETVG
jgi:hypothetical protein